VINEALFGTKRARATVRIVRGLPSTGERATDGLTPPLRLIALLLVGLGILLITARVRRPGTQG
jgi:hypothetical protein